MQTELQLIGLKVIMGDPGRTADAFAWVGTQLKLDTEAKIEFRLAKQFFKTPYGRVAAYARKIYALYKPNFMGIETNNRGKEVLSLFHRKYDLTFLQGVSTSANMTEKARQMGFAMDKPFMVEWFKEKMDEQMFSFPGTPSKDMQELIDQIPKITRFMSPSGKTSYKAYRNQHDDLFMAALHCTNYIRLFIDQQKRLR